MQKTNAKITVASVAHCHGRFLFIEETIRGERVVTQPTGRWESHETLVDTVVRETYEESGHRFEAEAIGGVYFWQHPRRGVTVMRVNFIGEARKDNGPVELDEGIERVAWLTRQEIVDSRVPHRNPMVLKTIDDYLAGKRYPLSLVDHAQRDWLSAM
ncbi:MAG: NUDIX hydrolase [Pseudomonadota bacterium]